MLWVPLKRKKKGGNESLKPKKRYIGVFNDPVNFLLLHCWLPESSLLLDYKRKLTTL